MKLLDTSAYLQMLRKGPANPNFPLTVAQARADLKRMRLEPSMPPRPILVLSGYHSPKMQAAQLRRSLLRFTHPQAPIIAIGYPSRTRIGQIVGDVLIASAKHIQPDHEVDVIGISMGGLIARAVCTGEPLRTSAGIVPARRALRVRRVFTLASPHRGALLAEKIVPDSAAKDMQAGSVFLQDLDALSLPAKCGYELTCYSRIYDGWVGATRAAPPGHSVLWTQGLPWGSHFSVSWDAIILADLSRRLRLEEPWASNGQEPPRD
jgi:pimeloyl-ACP methyl ester carboxylesterase